MYRTNCPPPPEPPLPRRRVTWREILHVLCIVCCSYSAISQALTGEWWVAAMIASIVPSEVVGFFRDKREADESHKLALRGVFGPGSWKP